MVIYAGSRRRCYLPSDLCMREGVSDEDVLRGQNTEHVSNVVFQVATQAKVSPALAKYSVLETLVCSERGWIDLLLSPATARMMGV